MSPSLVTSPSSNQAVLQAAEAESSNLDNLQCVNAAIDLELNNAGLTFQCIGKELEDCRKKMCSQSYNFTI